MKNVYISNYITTCMQLCFDFRQKISDFLHRFKKNSFNLFLMILNKTIEIYTLVKYFFKNVSEF